MALTPAAFGPYHWNLFNIESEAITILSNDHESSRTTGASRYDTVLLVLQFSVLVDLEDRSAMAQFLASKRLIGLVG